MTHPDHCVKISSQWGPLLHDFRSISGQGGLFHSSDPDSGATMVLTKCCSFVTGACARRFWGCLRGRRQISSFAYWGVGGDFSFAYWGVGVFWVLLIGAWARIFVWLVGSEETMRIIERHLPNLFTDPPPWDPPWAGPEPPTPPPAHHWHQRPRVSSQNI